VLVALPAGAAFVEHEKGRAREFAAAVFGDKVFRSGDKKWLHLTDSQRLKVFQRIVELHSNLYGTPNYKVVNAALPADVRGQYNHNTSKIEVDLTKIRQGGLVTLDTYRVLFHELSHGYQEFLALGYATGTLRPPDPRYQRARIYALQIHLAVPHRKGTAAANKIYNAQPVETDSREFARRTYLGMEELWKKWIRKDIKRSPK